MFVAGNDPIKQMRFRQDAESLTGQWQSRLALLWRMTGLGSWTLALVQGCRLVTACVRWRVDAKRSAIEVLVASEGSLLPSTKNMLALLPSRQ